MAKKSAVEKNNRRKKMAKSAANKRADLKATIYNKNTSLEERMEAVFKLAEMPRNSSKTRIKNRCELTGRPRAYYRKFRMSRIALRQLALAGLLPGVKKSSW
ncbi:MAG: 30S ribosomal protein S14 [Alphaproteobacteria bacterium]|nr:30S ribosomal protein S14 [Alphaproteobacteria bacterium]OJV16374.1 MAG: 30S ribosomal protein S14 [Alphaproteobacteria bacterium 33-17]